MMNKRFRCAVNQYIVSSLQKVCNTVFGLKSNKNEYQNIDLDNNIGQYRFEIVLLALGSRLFRWFCTIYI